MTDKVLYSILLPASNNTFELWIPNELTVNEATQLAARILEEQESREFKTDRSTALYLKSSGVELDTNKHMGEYEFVNGTQLVLM